MTEDCIFCRIVSGVVSAERVHDGQSFIVIRDIEPQAPVHLLFISKRHVPSLREITPADHPMMAEMLAAIPQVATQLRISDGGYKVVINTGAHGGQTIPHLHLHLLGGAQLPSMF